MPPPLDATVSSFGPQALAQLVVIANRAAGRAPGKPAGAQERERDELLSRRIGEFGQRIERVFGGLAVGAAGAAAGLARRGFSGTVESAQFGFQMEQLGRQMAAAFMPFMQAATHFATRLTNAMRNMSNNDLNRVAGGTVGALGGFALGGPGGAIAGGLAGSRFGGGDIDAGLGIGAGFLGWRGAAGRGAVTRLGVGFAAAAPFALASEGEDHAARIRKDVSRDLGMSEESRTVRLLTWFGKVGAGATDLVTGGAFDRRAKETGRIAGDKPPDADKGPRREVTPFQAEIGAAGSTYQKLQEAVLRVTAGVPEDAGPLQPIVDALEMIIQLLGKIAGVEIKFDLVEDARVGAEKGKK